MRRETGTDASPVPTEIRMFEWNYTFTALRNPQSEAAWSSLMPVRRISCPKVYISLLLTRTFSLEEAMSLSKTQPSMKISRQEKAAPMARSTRSHFTTNSTA